MRYSIVIANFNGRDLLDTCLSALVPQVGNPSDIIVVDNGSSDGSVEYLHREWSLVTTIPLDTNTGFTGANNTGASACDSDLIILLNNDTRPSPDWIIRLLRPFEDPSIGAVTSSMRRMSDISVMDSAGGELDSLGYTSDRGRGAPASRWTDPDEILFPCGGAMALRRDALDDAGSIFWDTLFCCNEDTDLGLRLWKSGYRCVYQPDAVVEHALSANAGKTSPVRVRFCTRNRILVLRRHLGEHFSRISGPLALWESLALGYMLVTGDLPRFRASIRGCRQGFSTKVEPYGHSEAGRDLYARFMRPTRGSAIRRKLGSTVYGRISRSDG